MSSVTRFGQKNIVFSTILICKIVNFYPSLDGATQMSGHGR